MAALVHISALRVETSHIAYAYSWFSGVLLAGGWLGPILV